MQRNLDHAVRGMNMPQLKQDSNLIDFDISRLGLELGWRNPSLTALLKTLAGLYRSLTLQLQSSLELQTILQLFLDSVGELIPLDGLRYLNPPGQLDLALGLEAGHTASYRLSLGQEPLGELVFRRHSAFEEFELQRLEVLLPTLLFPLRNALCYHRVLMEAICDPLTGIGNRIAMNQTLQREIELAHRQPERPLSLLMLDIDHFKSVNDQHGHQCGDQALKAVASTLKAQLRSMDLLFRFGGEEFLVLLSNTSATGAVQVGERLCLGIHNLAFQHAGQRVPLSVSIGCATYQPPESLDNLLDRVDAALYTAKRNGRNQLYRAP